MRERSGAEGAGGEVVACGEEEGGRSNDVLDEVGEVAIGVVVENKSIELGFSEGF